MLFPKALPALLALAGAVALPEKRQVANANVQSTSSSGSSYTPSSVIQTDLLAAKGMINLAIYEAQTFQGGQKCNLQTVSVRREWSDLSSAERTAYINAQLCLMKAPSKQTPGFPTGAKTRYDDFVAVHINQTLFIHGTANFLAWHRYFTWSYEQALKTECGYQGTLPYWNWGKYAYDLLNSPLFDGSATSMGGNGVYEAHNCTEALPTDLNCIPPGAGGGCVKSGPFTGYTANLGPVSPTLQVPEVQNNIPKNPLSYNPRCVRRDISTWVSSNWTSDAQSYDLLTNYNTILTFQNRMQGDFPSGFYGVHTGGHFSTNGDPGGDLFASPAEPTFFLHHAQIDRTWTIWQNQDLKDRQYALAGNTSLIGPSPPGKLTDPIYLANLAPQVTNNDVMSTLAGPLCYIYL